VNDSLVCHHYEDYLVLLIFDLPWFMIFLKVFRSVEVV